MTAAEVLALVSPHARYVEVIGAGVLSEELRCLLDDRLSAADLNQRPEIIIELTGQQHSIRAALQRVDDVGTIILAGPVSAAPLELDLYSDVHLRGLTLIGLPNIGA